MNYDYRNALREDIREWLDENGEKVTEANRDKIYDRLWVEDSVTGNASGSYTFSTYQAEENICHNWDLLREAMQEFGSEGENVIERGAEWCDVTIRCYLLGEILGEFVTARTARTARNNTSSPAGHAGGGIKKELRHEDDQDDYRENPPGMGWRG